MRQKCMRDDCEYRIDHIVRHAGKGANSLDGIRLYGYTAPDETTDPNAKMSLHVITEYRRKAHAKRMKQKA